MVTKATPVLLVALALVLGPSASAYAAPPVAECATVYTNPYVPDHPWVELCPPVLIGR